MKKKYSFSLLEVLIASALCSLLTLFVIQQLRHSAFLKKEITLANETHLKEENFETILQNYLLAAKSNEITIVEDPFSIHFICTKEIDLDPEFSDDLEFFLTLKKNALLIEITPKSALKAKKRVQRIFRDVENISAHVYSYDQKEKKFILYEKTKNQTPVILQLEMKTKDRKKNFNFYLKDHHKLIFEL